MPLTVGELSPVLSLLAGALGSSPFSHAVMAATTGVLLGWGPFGRDLGDFFSDPEPDPDPSESDEDDPYTDDLIDAFDPETPATDDDPDAEAGESLGLADLEDPDEWDVDSFGETSGSAELETRLDELENDLDSTASTVNALRNEYESLTGSIEDIQDNVRRLLEIYELVTRGVNPFVDDAQEEGEFPPGSFGLFTRSAGGSTDRVADPDDLADSFFADSLGGVDDEADETATDDFEDSDSTGSDAAIDASTAPSADDSVGTTFDDLKSEYEAQTQPAAASGAASTARTPTEEPPDPETDPQSSVESLLEDVERAQRSAAERFATDRQPQTPPESDAPRGTTSPERDRVEPETPPVEQEPTDPPPNTAVHSDAEEPAPDGPTGPAVEPEDDLVPDSTDEDTTQPEPTAGEGKPYLPAIPDGMGGEALAMEWVEFLVGRSSAAGAMRAFAHYEDLGWIGEPAAEQLRTLLVGADGSPNGARPPDGSLTTDDHLRSLSFIQRLQGDLPTLTEYGQAGRERTHRPDAVPSAAEAGREEGKPHGIQR